MREDVITRIEQEKLIAIVRGIRPDQYLAVAEALYDGGVRLMEITFNQSAPDSFRATVEAITLIGKMMEGRMLVGTGTVLTEEQVDLTAQAGGQFIISPDVNTAVIQRSVSLGLVSMPGAMTPTEVLTAHRAGADFVKLFPASLLGPDYIRAIRAPISHVKLLAVGGIDENNMPAFLRSGVCGFGVGGNLANKKWIENGDYYKLTEAARRMVQAVRVSAAMA